MVADQLTAIFEKCRLLIIRLFVSATLGLSMMIGCGLTILAGTIDMCLPFINFSEKLDLIVDALTLNPLIYTFSSFCNRKIYFHGDSIDGIKPNSTLVICNHQSAADVPIITSVLYQFLKRRSNIRFMAKNSISYIPVFGAALRYKNGMALKRKNTKRDLSLINRYTKKFVSKNKKSTTIIFPEGTRLNINETLKKSSEYLTSIGRKPTKYVLAPRLKGCREIIRSSDGVIDSIIDVTICYHRINNNNTHKTNTVTAPSYFEMIANPYIHVHIHIQHIPYNTIEHQSNDCSFLYDIFNEKDNFIKNFIDNPQDFDTQKQITLKQCYIKNSSLNKYINSGDSITNTITKRNRIIDNKPNHFHVNKKNCTFTKNSSKLNGISSSDNTDNDYLHSTSLSIPWIMPSLVVSVNIIILILLQLLLGTRNHIVLWMTITIIGYVRVIASDILHS